MANYITILRIVLIFPVLILVSPTSALSNWMALFIFIVAGLTDHLDGYLARKTGTTSDLGGLLDLIADKLLICTTIVFLISFGDRDALVIPSIIIIARELIISSFRQFVAENSNFSNFKVSLIGKFKTTIQITALSFLIVSPNFLDTFYSITVFLFWLASFLSVYSLFDYLRSYYNKI
tara:strand:+ start:3030 stop:3563 length:534 start_codon:yes stop_codon:yes gene_type:complete